MGGRIAILLVFILSSVGHGADTIPLSEVWAYNMPGTIDLSGPSKGRDTAKLIESIRKSLSPKNYRKQARQGFVVLGEGQNALPSVRKILAGDSESILPDEFPKDEKLSVVFFSYQSESYAYLESVQRDGFNINIKYSLIPHQSSETTEHLALIPLGNLPPGKYVVQIELVPLEKKYIEQGFSSLPDSVARRLVSQPFEFVVRE